MKNPKRNIPRAIISTLILTFLLYSLVTLVSLGAIGSTGMSESGSPLFSAARVMTWPGIVTVIGIAAVTAMMGVLLSQILAGSRMFFAMGRRGDLPKKFSTVSPRNQVPVYGVFLSALVILLTVWLGELTFVTKRLPSQF